MRDPEGLCRVQEQGKRAGGARMLICSRDCERMAADECHPSPALANFLAHDRANLRILPNVEGARRVKD
jgi:hypothetical protein